MAITLFEDERRLQPRVGEEPPSEHVRGLLAVWERNMAALRTRVQAALPPTCEPERRSFHSGIMSE